MPPQLFFVPPMEAKEVRSASQLPTGADWQYEIKLDGYRCIAIKQRNEAELFSRRGLAFKQFPNVNRELQAQGPRSFIVDGEVVALDAEGRPDFNSLQNSKGRLDVHLYAFDLLHLDGRDLMRLPLTERQEILRAEFAFTDFFHPPPVLSGKLPVLLRKIRKFGFEGIVAKRRDSIYQPGARPGTWVKLKLKQTDEFIIGGYISNGKAVEELIVGKYRGRDLVFVASVDDGFVPATRRRVFDALVPLETAKCPFVNLPERKGRRSAFDAEKMRKAHWVRPKLVVELAFNEWTPDRHLRHGECKWLRSDKTTREVSSLPE